MPDFVLLPSSSYQPPPTPSQVRRPGRSLNTIIEEPDDAQSSGAETTRQRPKMQAQSSSEKIVQWLSPQSDHFPTPRGFHFLSAPILPDSESDVSADESNSPSITSSSNAWNRVSVSTDVTEFDDIYDVSDDDDNTNMKRNSSLKRTNSSRGTHARRMSSTSSSSPSSTRSLPPLVIPNEVSSFSGRPELKKLMSPVPPTPPAKVEMSPAVISFMQSQQSQDVPTVSAPPSLDGSLSSDQMAAMSAPPTPVIGVQEEGLPSDWAGVQLQPGALATLQALSGGEDSDQGYTQEQVIEVPQERLPEMMQQRTPRASASIPPVVARISTVSRQSLNDLTRLEIPSPGGFFSGLSPRTRSTWHPLSADPEDVAPPTSTTAEQFYRCPWNEPTAAPAVPSVPEMVARFNIPPPPPRRPAHLTNLTLPPPPSSSSVSQTAGINGAILDGGLPTARPIILERIVESREDLTPGLPTAIRLEPEQTPKSPEQKEPSSPNRGDATEIVTGGYDPDYTRKMQQEALSHLDRTELWLMAQKAYLQGVDLKSPTGSESDQDVVPETPALPIVEELKAPAVEPSGEPAGADNDNTPQRKKTVRFSNVVTTTNVPRSLPSRFARQENAFYRAFLEYIIRSRSQDAFVHRLPRFEALQTQRISLPDKHRNQLLGKYQLSVVPQSAKKRMSANVARGDFDLVDDPSRIKKEKEQEAFAQIATASWQVAATKALHGGRLFSAPIAKRLARLSRMSLTASNRTRILDLGGQATGDWAWHCALAYPNTKVYTVTTKVVRQLSNSNIRGPPNHRQVAVSRLTKLPFPDGHFDLISARELHSLLKFVGENGCDEWESCLAECYRVLKPGGYLEFALLDSDVINAGPLGLAKSVEFGFSLKTLGYDPQPTRLFLPRLGRAGFQGVKRTWLCLPVGPRPPPAGPPPVPVKNKDGGKNTPSITAAAAKKEVAAAPVELPPQQGTTNAAASVSGVAGSWAWEKWLLRCEMEKVASERRLHNEQPADSNNDEDEKKDAAKGREEDFEAAIREGIAGVSAVIEEGRRTGAGWRWLHGFARKPLTSAAAE